MQANCDLMVERFGAAGCGYICSAQFPMAHTFLKGNRGKYTRADSEKGN